MTHPPLAKPEEPTGDGDAEQELVRHCSKCFAIYRSEFTRCPVDGAHVITSSGDPMIGVTIAEHYQIDELIGIGSSGRVYLAHHSRLSQRRFALKILFGDLAATSTARLRFTHEAESASRLAHPNLVSVVDFGRTPAGLLYLAMDYIEGPNLAHLIARDGAMPQERAVRLGLQLCRGLAHAHDLGLVHRDFKPDNILVSSDAHGDVPRIVDFGIALSATDIDGDPRLTAMGVTLGTPAYAAPEQATDGHVDHRADLFALGVTLYELLTGMLPFDGSLVEMMRLNATVDPPPMMERNPEVMVTPALQQVVSKLMARDPAKRYQTAREVLEALAELPRRPGSPLRPSSGSLPTAAQLAGARHTPTSMAVKPQHLTPPAMRPVSATPTSATGSRPSAPAIGSRPSAPAIGSRPSAPAIGSRPSAPAIGSRPSAPAIGGSRPSSPTIGSRASAPVIGPLVIPSSSPTRMQSAPVIEVPESLRTRTELAPLVTPISSSRPRTLTLVLAVTIAAVVSATAVVGYQRLTRDKPAPPALTTPVSPPAAASTAPSAPAAVPTEAPATDEPKAATPAAPAGAIPSDAPAVDSTSEGPKPRRSGSRRSHAAASGEHTTLSGTSGEPTARRATAE